MNKISVIIPVYNTENYIKRCIDSVCSQTYGNIEIIAVDDGSTDNSGAVLDELAEKDRRIVVIHKENGGVSSARAEGVYAATGDYIGFVDGDDTIDPDMYEILLKNLLDSNADISHCGFRMIVGERTDYYYNTDKYIVCSGEDAAVMLTEGSLIEPALVTKLFKSELIKKACRNKVLDGISYLEDLLLNYITFSESHITVFQDVCKYNYIVRANSASTSGFNPKKFEDPVYVFKYIMDSNKKGSRLYEKAFSRYIGFLINYSVTKGSSEYKSKAKYLLRSTVPEIMASSFVSKKTKIMAIGTVFFHPLYVLVRRIYEKISGIDKKYDVN